MSETATSAPPAPSPRRLLRSARWLLLGVLPLAAAMWASWGVVMDPRHGTDLHGYQAVGRAISSGQAFYSSAIPGQFLLSPVGAVLVAPTALLPDPVLHLGWGMLCALAALGLLHRAGLRGFTLALLAAIVVTVPPGREAMSQGRMTWLIMLAVVVDLIDWQQRPRWLPRGLLTGLATAVWPFTWPFLAVLAVRRRRAGLAALGTAVAVSLAVAVFLPRMTLVYWTEVLPARFAVRDSTLASSNHSVLGAALRLFGPQARWPALLVMLLAGLAAIAAAIWWERLGKPWLAVALSTVAILVASPLVPNPDLAWILLPVLAVTIARPPPAAPIGWTVLLMVGLAFVLADPLGALPRFKPVADFGLVERLLTAGIPTMALILAAAGLVDAWVSSRTPGRPDQPLARFWNHPVTIAAGSIALVVLAAAWCAAITDADVHAFVHWTPAMADFEVYIRAGQAFVAGRPLYVAQEGQWPFLYPPFAAILAVPLGVLPRGLVQFGWTALTALALLALFRRLGLTGWNIAFATMVSIFIAGPIRSTIGLGQISVLLMVMCLVEIVPWPTSVPHGLRSRDRRVERSERAPWPLAAWQAAAREVSQSECGGPGGAPRRGAIAPQSKSIAPLIGIATAIKLTPGLFIPLLWFTGRRRAAIVAAVTAAAACLLGFAVSPRQSWQYWTQVALGGLEFFPDPRGWLHNQSWVSAWQRFVGLDPTLTRIGIGIGAVFTILGLIAAIRWARRGHLVLGASLCGLASLMVLPVAWNHYFVWALPLGVALLQPGVPRALREIGLVTAAWLVTEPFWTVAYAGPDPLEFVHWGLAEKLVGGAGALLTITMFLVAVWIRPPEQQVSLATQPLRALRKTRAASGIGTAGTGPQSVDLTSNAD